MVFDAVLGDRRCWWLSPAEDKRTFFDARETGLRNEEYPHIAFGAARNKIIRCFPDKLPIGIDKEDPPLRLPMALMSESGRQDVRIH